MLIVMQADATGDDRPGLDLDLGGEGQGPGELGYGGSILFDDEGRLLGITTAPGRDGDTFEGGREFVHLLRENTTAHGIELIDVDDPRQGIEHVIATELGIACCMCV